MAMSNAPRTALEAAVEAGVEEVRLAILGGQGIQGAVRNGHQRTIEQLASQAGLDQNEVILRYWDAAVKASMSIAIGLIDYPDPPEPTVVGQCEECGEDLHAGQRVYATPDGILCGDCLVMFAEDYVIDRGIVRAGYLNRNGQLE